MHALTTALQEATSELLYMSESDYPVTPLHWTAAEVGTNPLDTAFLAAKAGLTTALPAVKMTPEAFFAPLTAEEEWYDDADRETAKRYKSLFDLLRTSLSDFAVYKVGEAQKHLFAIGRTPEGDVLGVQTIAIET